VKYGSSTQAKGMGQVARAAQSEGDEDYF